MANGRMTNYIVPTAADTPRIKVEFIEQAPASRRSGPSYGPGGGAKGIGELPLDGGAPAIANAIEHAVGAAIDHIPLTPEMLMAALAANEKGRGA